MITFSKDWKTNPLLAQESQVKNGSFFLREFFKALFSVNVTSSVFFRVFLLIFIVTFNNLVFVCKHLFKDKDLRLK